MSKISPTYENYRKYAHAPIARWLIEAAHRPGRLTYGDTKKLLIEHENFTNLHAASLGHAVGAMMERILKVEPSAPLLNILMVDQKDGVPGEGAYDFLKHRISKKRLPGADLRQTDVSAWRAIYEEAAGEVYGYQYWPDLFHRVFGETYEPAPFIFDQTGSEKDGKSYGRNGEGENHKRLRLWVKDNPGQIGARYSRARTETEVVLASGDRADVMFYMPDQAVAIEVKSRDSNLADLSRGVYQCVKYRAVVTAMDIRSEPYVTTILVTENKPAQAILDLARRLVVQIKTVGELPQ